MRLQLHEQGCVGAVLQDVDVEGDYIGRPLASQDHCPHLQLHAVVPPPNRHHHHHHHPAADPGCGRGEGAGRPSPASGAIGGGGVGALPQQKFEKLGAKCLILGTS